MKENKFHNKGEKSECSLCSPLASLLVSRNIEPQKCLDKGKLEVLLLLLFYNLRQYIALPALINVDVDSRCQ